jgi:hypothetical protein
MARPVINEIAIGKTAYLVRVLGSRAFEPQTFLGDFAFDRANDYLEGLLTDAAARQVWLFRYSRQEWQLVIGVQQNPAEKSWEPIRWADAPRAWPSPVEDRAKLSDPQSNQRLNRVFGR